MGATGFGWGISGTASASSSPFSSSITLEGVDGLGLLQEEVGVPHELGAGFRLVWASSSRPGVTFVPQSVEVVGDMV